jgi:hypothetical protein
MSRPLSPRHPSVLASPQVMTPERWRRAYRWPLTQLIGGGIGAMLAPSLLPPITLDGWPFLILWAVPFMAIMLRGLSRCYDLYEIELELERREQTR